MPENQLREGSRAGYGRCVGMPVVSQNVSRNVSKLGSNTKHSFFVYVAKKHNHMAVSTFGGLTIHFGDILPESNMLLSGNPLMSTKI